MALDIPTLTAILSVAVPAGSWLIGCLARGWKAFTILTSLASEFKTNGGKSLRDRIEAINDSLDTLVAANAVSLSLVPYAFFRADGAGNIVWVNRQFVHETQLSETDSCGLGWLNCVSPEDRDRVRDSWFDALSDRRASKVPFKMTDGRSVLFETIPIVSQKFGLVGLIGTLRIENNGQQH